MGLLRLDGMIWLATDGAMFSIEELFTLNGKTALVTGGTAGLGLVCVM